MVSRSDANGAERWAISFRTHVRRKLFSLVVMLLLSIGGFANTTRGECDPYDYCCLLSEHAGLNAVVKGGSCAFDPSEAEWWYDSYLHNPHCEHESSLNSGRVIKQGTDATITTFLLDTTGMDGALVNGMNVWYGFNGVWSYAGYSTFDPDHDPNWYYPSPWPVYVKDFGLDTSSFGNGILTVGLTPVVDPYGGCFERYVYFVITDRCTGVASAGSPYPIVRKSVDGDREDTIIELRHDTFPQAVDIYFDIDPNCVCLFNSATSARLTPVSGTGPVFDVMLQPTVDSVQGHAYFYIDEMAAPGEYRLEGVCADGSDYFLDVYLQYIGYVGHQPSGWIYNSVTGNVIRGASVTLQKWNGTGWDSVETTVAGDGSYEFASDGAGQYRVFVEYELGGEHYRGPFMVGDAIPYEDIYLVPVTDDTEPPSVTVLEEEKAVGYTAIVVDGLVGNAVVEVVPGTIDNLTVNVDRFDVGATSVTVDFRLIDEGLNGSATLLCIDTLGNPNEVELSIQSASGVDDEAPPLRHVLSQCYPNPFNPNTNIDFEVVATQKVWLTIYDLQGHRIRTLIDGVNYPPGKSSVTWDGCDDSGSKMAAGVYLYRYEAGQFSDSKRMVLLK